jgi:predicted dehydrogenase
LERGLDWLELFEALKMKNARLGIIGLGYVGKIHFDHLLKIRNAELLAVADVSEKALNRAKKDGVKKVFKNYEDLLKEPGIDGVIIGLPTHLHTKCAVQAAEAGKHIFLEKPMARTVKESKEILAAAEKNSVKLMMGYHFRFSKILTGLKEQIDKGLLGDIELANAIFISSGPFTHRAEGHTPIPVPEWWWNKELTGGGVLMDLGSHMINILRYYFGEITDIESHLGYRFNLSFEDSAICLAKFNSGTIVTLNIGWFSQSYTLKINFMGSIRSATVEHATPNPMITAMQMLITGRSKFREPHLNELQHFIRCLNEDIEPCSTGQDGLKDMEAIEMAYKNQRKL